MSVASSAYETKSVSFFGQEVTVEEALRRTVLASQEALNNIEINLRHLACLDDQQLDEVEDFKFAVDYEDKIVDFVNDLEDSLDQLPTISAEIRGPCPKDAKEWYTKHKADRKAAKLAEKEKKKQDAAIKKSS